MTDRLSQLQICLDQLVDQFISTLNYVDKNHDFVPSPTEERLADPQATVAPEGEFKDTMNELSTDLITKTRQILTLIDSLPGADASQGDQLTRIKELQEELEKVQREKVEAVKRKEELVDWCDGLIVDFSRNLIESKRETSMDQENGSRN